MSKTSQLTELKSFFIKIKNSIIALDDSIVRVLIIDITETMVAIMLNIWTISLSDDSPIIKENLEGFAFNTITSSVKLVISCFINGLVHEESERIYSVLDNFKAEDFDANEYKEWLMFKNISKEKMFGFTIGGFAALRKTTLIPVKKNFFFFFLRKLLTDYFFYRYSHS
jgi:hypothetical protein